VDKPKARFAWYTASRLRFEIRWWAIRGGNWAALQKALGVDDAQMADWVEGWLHDEKAIRRADRG
jgi:hypothetical protein